jgi:hypothetical protein
MVKVIVTLDISVRLRVKNLSAFIKGDEFRVMKLRIYKIFHNYKTAYSEDSFPENWLISLSANSMNSIKDALTSQSFLIRKTSKVIANAKIKIPNILNKNAFFPKRCIFLILVNGIYKLFYSYLDIPEKWKTLGGPDGSIFSTKRN